MSFAAPVFLQIGHLKKGSFFPTHSGDCLFLTGHNLSVNLVVSRRLPLELDQSWKRVGAGGASIWVNLVLIGSIYKTGQLRRRWVAILTETPGFVSNLADGRQNISIFNPLNKDVLRA